MNIKLTIKSIIKWEQLTNKSFNNIDFTDNNEMMQLLYCIILTNNDEVIEYEDFIELFENKKISKEIFSKFQKILKNIEQFTEKKEVCELDNIETTETQYIKDIASLLIVQAGLSATYVLNEMEITDISYLMKSYNNKVKEKMEADRLWCYMSILPHIDSRKCDSPAKFYPFPWELENIKQEEKQTISSMREDFEMIMKNTNNK